jgi:hypothetical protein
MSRREGGADDDHWFEAIAARELRRLPTSAWGDMVALRRGLPRLRPATRRRLLAHCVELAYQRGDPLPEEFAVPAIRELTAGKPPRAGVRDEARFRAAACCFVMRRLLIERGAPQASLKAIAADIGMPGKARTVDEWSRRPEFHAECREALARLKTDFWALERRLSGFAPRPIGGPDEKSSSVHPK